MPQDPVAPLVADYARYRADETIRLEDYDTAETDDLTPEQARTELAALNERIAELQARLTRRVASRADRPAGHRRRGQGLTGQTRLPRHESAGRARVAGGDEPCWPRPDEDLEAYAPEELEESASSKR